MVFNKLVVFILIAGIFFSSAYSAYASDWFYAVKEFGIDLGARAISRALVRSLSNQLIQKIQTGGEGGKPAFVQNWRDFQTDSQYRGENVFRAILSNTKLCDYIDKDIKGLFGVANKIPLPANFRSRTGNFDPYALRANCTMPSSFNIASYQQDFAGNGGWQAWNRLLEPQNNYYGALFNSLDEASRQRTLEESASVNDAQAGSGYISTGDPCVGSGAGAKCTFLGQKFTPGDLLGKTAAATIDQDMTWLTTSDELSETLLAVISATVTRLTNLAGSRPPADETTEILAKDESLRTEYCSAKFPSKEALGKYGKTPGFESSFDLAKFKKSGFKSPCEKVRDQYGSDNPYPYQRCIIACFKAVGVIPANVIVPTPPPIPTDEPPDDEPACTEEEKSPTDNEPPSLRAQIQTEIDKYTLPTTKEQQGQILNRVAWNNQGWVLLGKAGGNNCPAPSGTLVSCDYLVHQPTMLGYDVFSSEGAPDMKASWGGPDACINKLVQKGSRTLVPPTQP